MFSSLFYPPLIVLICLHCDSWSAIRSRRGMYYHCILLRDLFICPCFLSSQQSYGPCFYFISLTRNSQQKWTLERSETMLCYFIRRQGPERFCWRVGSTPSTRVATLWGFSASLMSLAKKSHAGSSSLAVCSPRGLWLGPVFHLAWWNILLPPS